MFVLIVEGVEETAEALDAFLSVSGYETEVTTTGERALALVEARRPDVVVLGLGLPDVPGETVAARLKTRENAQYVIAYSGHHRRESDALAAGCDRFVLKPQLDRLAAALDESARRARQTKAK